VSRLGPAGAEWRLAPPPRTAGSEDERIPTDLLQAVLREHLDDPTAVLIGLELAPVPVDGYSGNRLYRVRFDWAGAAGRHGTATWVVKRWLPGGHAERLLGVDRPLEALACEAGLLRPDAVPPGLSVPMLGARRDPDGRAAWIVMEDASEALQRYSRDAPLHPTEAVARAAQVLDGLARLHVWWEHPERQARLGACPWLVPMERVLWCEAASFAGLLGRAVPAGLAPGSAPSEESRADLAAFLAWLPAGDRARFESLLTRREPLVDALRALPRTLLHGDTDDRNVGLGALGPGAASAHDEALGPDLVLIDWEWIGHGPPALDVARLWATLPAVCDHTLPPPEETFTFDLPDHYFDRYRSYGGVLTDRVTWRRACTLAMLGHGFGQIGFFGAMIRHDVKPVLANIARQFEMIAGAARSLIV